MPELEKNKLFVGNLDNRVKWFHLKEFFAQYGEVAYTKVVSDRETGKSRGFGFIIFESEDDAANALQQANDTCIELPDIVFPDRPIRLMYAEKKEGHGSENQEAPTEA